ncbi:MAG: hypothetical protein ACEY3D_04440 [Rickettsia sp.]|uniref:hypothetical protein n=1 Tax=Rickettsia sp. TaxID=789 RepID=UPI00397A5288
MSFPRRRESRKITFIINRIIYLIKINVLLDSRLRGNDLPYAPFNCKTCSISSN